MEFIKFIRLLLFPILIFTQLAVAGGEEGVLTCSGPEDRDGDGDSIRIKTKHNIEKNIYISNVYISIFNEDPAIRTYGSKSKSFIAKDVKMKPYSFHANLFEEGGSSPVMHIEYTRGYKPVIKFNGSPWEFEFPSPRPSTYGWTKMTKEKYNLENIPFNNDCSFKLK